MRKANAFILTLALMGTVFQGNADQQHFARTGDKNLTCKLRPLSEPRCQDLIGLNYMQSSMSYIGYALSREKKDTSNEKINHPLAKVPKKYMAIEVRIRNNGDKPVDLVNGEYLEGIESYLVPKEDILSIYPSTLTKFIGPGFTVGLGVLLGICTYKFWNYVGKEGKKVGKAIKDKDLKSLAYWWTMFWKIATYGTTIGLAGIGGYDIYRAIQFMKRYSDIQNSAKCTKDGLMVSYPSDETILRIPAKSDFTDLVFIDLKRADRTVFRKLTPKLAYTYGNVEPVEEFEEFDEEEFDDAEFDDEDDLSSEEDFEEDEDTEDSDLE